MFKTDDPQMFWQFFACNRNQSSCQLNYDIRKFAQGRKCLRGYEIIHFTVIVTLILLEKAGTYILIF